MRFNGSWVEVAAWYAIYSRSSGRRRNCRWLRGVLPWRPRFVWSLFFLILRIVLLLSLDETLQPRFVIF